MNFKIWLTALLFAVSTPLMAADSAKDTCLEASRLAEKDPKAALEEARWCVEMLEQMIQKMSASLFPDEVAGFKGDEISQQKAMGFAMTERTYRKGDTSIKAALNQGKAGGFNMAALAQFGAMAGGQRVRIQGMTGVILPQGSKTTITFSLSNGGTLIFESSNADRETLETFCGEFPLKDLDGA